MDIPSQLRSRMQDLNYNKILTTKLDGNSVFLLATSWALNYSDSGMGVG